MTKGTGTLAARKRKSSSRKASSRNFIGTAAVACLVLGSGWTVYSNILSTSAHNVGVDVISDGTGKMWLTCDFGS